MAFEYLPAAGSGAIRQGELLGDLWEHQPLLPPTEQPEGAQLPYRSIHHPLVIVMTQDCDLLWDFNARFSTEEARQAYEPEASDIDSHQRSISHVVCCDVYTRDAIRERVAGGDVMKRVARNQDERYHCLPEAPMAGEIGDDAERGPFMTEIFLDFNKSFAVPTKQFYMGLRPGGVNRLAMLPPVFLHDLLHRYYGYLSRVALPVP